MGVARAFLLRFFLKLGTIDTHAQDIEKRQKKDGVTVLVFALHARHSKGFLLRCARNIRNLINWKNFYCRAKTRNITETSGTAEGEGLVGL